MKTKTQKREEALARALARSKRSPADQLAKLDAGSFRAAREREKLAKLIQAAAKINNKAKPQAY